MAKDGGGFDFSAINGSMAKQLVKDMLAAFDADTNRKRLAKAILAARDDTDALMLKVLPLATAIASEALGRWGIEEDSEGNAFVEVMNRAAKESEIPNFKGSDLGRFPLVSADFWTSDHLSGRSRSVDAFVGTRARGTFMLKKR
jgi:hypothetical protein